MTEEYSAFFERITGHAPFPFQERYASKPFTDTLIVVPTGLGKTQAVLVPWLYAQTLSLSAPRHLFFVLPRQNLTRQTFEIATKLVTGAGLEARVRILELLGGSGDNAETLWPDETAIIVATQDMYFSRALNRGYAQREPRWPMDFAIYNQDCLVVLDEIQLMNEALATSRQLAAFRERFEVFGSTPCIWMSATVNPDWLVTVDAKELPPRIQLDQSDCELASVKRKIHAVKSIHAAPVSCREAAGLASFATNHHRAGTRTLVIVNTVARARLVFHHLKKKAKCPKLLHSRFRPLDRRRASESLSALNAEGEIVVATQVLEAGVDITSRLLVTDAAPWGSLVQRFGRLNRWGDDKDAEIWWVDKPDLGKKQKNPFAPYEEAEVERALEKLRTHTSGAPADLAEEDGPEPWEHVLRQTDLIDLFDTTPDLGGSQIDVSRFIRAGEDRDVYLAWRNWDGDGAPPPDMPEISSRELCPVIIGEFKEFAKEHPTYIWNFATEKWSKVDRDELYAGMIAVTRCREGGYTADEGWSPDSELVVEELREGTAKADSDSSDPLSYQSKPQILRDHTKQVCDEMEKLIGNLDVSPDLAEVLRDAAVWHDWGKAHPTFQKVMNSQDGEILAKQSRAAAKRVPEAKHFRHELASAVAMLASGHSDLAAYIVASHHGKVRGGIRSMPGEKESAGKHTARGISDGDILPQCEVAPNVTVEAIAVSLKTIEMGIEGGSWAERVSRLLDDLGPFRLAYLEMLLRVADWRASAFHEEQSCQQ